MKDAYLQFTTISYVCLPQRCSCTTCAPLRLSPQEFLSWNMLGAEVLSNITAGIDPFRLP